MESKIKSATIKDLKEIQRLNQMLFEKEYKEFDNTLNCKWAFGKDGKNYFKKCITEDDRCVFVAYLNNKIVGYLAGGIDNGGSYRILPKFAELDYMFVLSKYRGKGIGTKLYQTFLDWCKAKNVGKLRVIASAQNWRSINFYKKNGFFDYDLILETNI